MDTTPQRNAYNVSTHRRDRNPPPPHKINASMSKFANDSFVLNEKQKYRDSGPIEIDARHEIYGPRPNFHNTATIEHPTSNNNTNGCNGNSTVNGKHTHTNTPK